VRDLVVRRLVGEPPGEHPGQDLLQEQPVNAGEDDASEHQPQRDFEPAAQLEVGVAGDEHDAQRPEPQVAAEPRLSHPQPPPSREQAVRR
jgi:hypothetical protein